MSVTVKVQFKDKLFKLSQGINNIQQVDEEMKRRYSSKLPPLEYSFEGSIVEDLNVLLKAQSKEGKTSIKIVAHPLDDFSRLCENSIISIVSNEKESGPEVRKVEEEVIVLKENLVKVQKKLI
uniref:Uncharacterized protein n=2 Tax=Noccaea caerulescens TaxID=107243 RepID=A0A1J3J069_NOCCA